MKTLKILRLTTVLLASFAITVMASSELTSNTEVNQDLLKIKPLIEG